MSLHIILNWQDPLPELSKDTLYEVKTLRKVKRELENQLKESKSSTLSFQASFQAEFDLRTQTEQRLDQLRERYEVGSMCNLTN